MEQGKFLNRKGPNMSESSSAAAKARIPASDQPSPLYLDEILDWDVPSLDVPSPSDTIRVRVRDVPPEPMLDI